MSSRPEYKPMVIDDQALIKAYNEGKTVAELGKMFGYSKSAVAARALKLGCKRRCIDSTKLPIRAILQAYNEHNMTRTEIAKRVGCAATTIGRILRQHGIKLGKGMRVADQSQACVRLVRSGLTCVEAGRQLGLSRAQVGRRIRPILGKLAPWPPPCAPSSKLLELYRNGMSYQQIGKMYNRHCETIRERIKCYLKKLEKSSNG